MAIRFELRRTWCATCIYLEGKKTWAREKWERNIQNQKAPLCATKTDFRHKTHASGRFVRPTYPGVALRHDHLLKVSLRKVCLRRDNAAQVETRRGFAAIVSGIEKTGSKTTEKRGSSQTKKYMPATFPDLNGHIKYIRNECSWGAKH